LSRKPLQTDDQNDAAASIAEAPVQAAGGGMKAGTRVRIQDKLRGGCESPALRRSVDARGFPVLQSDRNRNPLFLQMTPLVRSRAH
jgi:hypothetical protein